MYALVFQKKPCLRLIHKFNLLKHLKHCNILQHMIQINKKKEKKKKKNTQLKTF